MDKTSRLQNTIHSLRFALSEQNLELMPEFEMRLDVLKRLGFIDQDNTVLLKGRVAREVRKKERKKKKEKERKRKRKKEKETEKKRKRNRERKREREMIILICNFKID